MITVSVPIVDKSFYTAAEISQLRYKLNTIDNTYKHIVEPLARINQTRKELITAVIFLESSGNAKAKTAYAFGLMGLAPRSMTDTVTRERKRGKISEYEKEIIKKHVGAAKFNKIMNAKMGDDFFTADECLIPELNICLGTMYLMQIVDEETKNGTVRLDRVIVRYNKGYYATIPSGSTQDLLNSNLPYETKSYILKLAGINGILDILL